MKIIAIDNSHFSAWLSLWKQYLVFYKTELDDAVTNETFARICDENIRNIGGFIALFQNEPVGFTHYIIHPNTWSNNEVCYLEDLFVAPHARGLGLGAALIGKVKNFATCENLKRVYWLTKEDNLTAQSLYNKLAKKTGFIQYSVDV